MICRPTGSPSDNPDGTDNPAYDDLLDMDNYIGYMLCNFWGGTGDWPGHNYYAACRKPPNATGFKFFNWDAEGAIVVWSSLNANVTGVSDGAAHRAGGEGGSMRLCMSIAELREEARRRVPRALFEYADCGAYDQVTLRRNRAAFDDIFEIAGNG